MRKRQGKRGNAGNGIGGRIKKARAAKRQRKNTKQENRHKRRDSKIAAKDLRKNAKISKKTAKKLSKIYGEMSPDEVNQLNEIQPHIGAMADELEAKDIPIDDDGDPLEIAAKYAQLNEDIPDPLDDEEYNEAFVDNEESFESVDKYNKRKAIVKSVLKGIVGGVNEFANQAAEKEKYGQPLSESEKNILQGKRDVTKAGVSEFINDNLKTIVGLLAAAVIIIFIVGKKKSA